MCGFRRSRKSLPGKILVAPQQHSGETVARVQNMARNLTERGYIGGRFVIHFAVRKIFHGGGGILADRAPGVQDLFHSDHDHIVREAAPGASLRCRL